MSRTTTCFKATNAWQAFRFIGVVCRSGGLPDCSYLDGTLTCAYLDGSTTPASAVLKLSKLCWTV
eukprot:6176105-Pleurochrysis_carterae.AAC.3